MRKNQRKRYFPELNVATDNHLMEDGYGIANGSGGGPKLMIKGERSENYEVSRNQEGRSVTSTLI